MTTETDSALSLRYTCEIGNPVLSAAKRIQTGLDALKHTAVNLGCGDLWQQLTPIWNEIQACAMQLPPGTRFCLWAGISQTAGDWPVLKVYINNLLSEQGASHTGLQSKLAAAGIPYTEKLQWVCDRLQTLGFPQEIGFGLRGDGKWSTKVYYEFFGWRPSLIAEISTELGFSETTTKIAPAIPGIISESLAQKRRSGLSFRLHPLTGEILELTTSVAFPVHLVAIKVMHKRILAWLQTQQEDEKNYVRLFKELFLKPPPPHHRAYSLFTRTINLAGQKKTTLYLRPII